MILVLDTNALWHAPLLQALVEARQREADVQPIVPAIAHAERLRQVRRDGLSAPRWMRMRELAGLEVEPFTAEHAEIVGGLAPDDAAWQRHARDYMIVAHVTRGRIGVTADRGSAWEGVRSITPAEAALAVAALRAP